MLVMIHFPAKPKKLATLVDVIPNSAPILPWQWEIYYGGKKYVRMGPVKHTRLVFKYEEGGFAIIPDIPKNRSFWTIVRPTG